MKKTALFLSVLFTFILAGTAQSQQTGDSQTHPSQQQTDTQQKPDTGGMMGGQGMGTVYISSAIGQNP